MEYGLIGEKLGHSFSKYIHEKLANYKYEIHEVKKDEFDDFMIKRDFKAINVTIPYKKMVIPYLDYIDDAAKRIGAVNTIVNNDGKLYGYNTDYLGLLDEVSYLGLDLKDKDVLILGTGGASLACYEVARNLGASSIIYCSRNKNDNNITYDELKLDPKYQIIFNSTPVGMYPNNDDRVLDLSSFKKLEGVIDCIYNPLKTNLVLESLESGIKSLGGLYMLVAQAYYACEKFIGCKLDKKMIDKIYKELLFDKQNIVFIGMPSCGKSTIGRLLSEKIDRQIYDVDKEIVKKIGMSIKDFFSLYGEDKFRDLETETVKELAKKSGIIISCGGGVIKRKENIDYLKQNGIVYFVDRKLDNLITTDDRPLSSNRNNLEKLYEERYPLYVKYADVIVHNDTDVFMDCVEDILGKINENISN